MRNARLERLASEGLKPLAFGLLLLPALLPLLRGDALPCTHDNMFHGYRIVAMRDMLRHGWLFSRWVPNLALGYGYPFFNYREPLPYLAGEVLHVLGLPVPLVLGLLYAGSLVGAAWGAYVLARDLFGERAAWIAGVAYGLSPYLLMDALRRGNMPESVGLALVPWLFVTTRRVILRRQRSDVAATVLLLVTLFLSHNISSLLLAPFLGAYVLLLSWEHRDRGGWPFALAAVGLAVLLTAWFWLPALTEQGFAQLHLSRTTRNNDFRYNFVGWREMLLTLPAAYDSSYLNPPMRIAVGFGQAVLGALGAVAGLMGRRQRDQRTLVALLTLFAVGYLWMASRDALGLWERLDVLSFVQFPWRLVGRALLPICLLAGLAVETALTRVESAMRGHAAWVPAGVVCVVVTALVLLAWPETYPPKGMCPSTQYPDMAELYARESEGWLGMDPESSYFPVWVEEHPQDLALATAFAEGALPERFDVSVLPPGGAVLSAQYRPLRARLVVRAPESFEARWLGLYFPGWSVRIDGSIVAVTPEAGTGLLTFPVAAGDHEIEVAFGTTALRRLGAVLVAVGLALSVPLAAAVLRWPRPVRDPAHGAAGAPLSGRNAAALRHMPMALLGLAAVLAGLRFAVVDQIETPIRRTSLPALSTPVDAAFAGGLSLVGLTQGTALLPADAELSVDLLWQARASMNTNYGMTVLLRGADGAIWSPAGTARPRGYEAPIPTRGWAPGQYAYDPHLVTVLPGTPPGYYDIVVTAFDAETLVADSVLGTNGYPAGPDLIVGSVRVIAPRTIPSLVALGVPAGSRVATCGSMGLWTMTADRASSAPGNIVATRWVWEALAAPETDAEALLTLLDPDGQERRSWSLAPATAWWPTGDWAMGERWVGRHVVRLPGDLDGGVYQLVGSLSGCPHLAQVALTVEAPDRQWSLPGSYDPVSVGFGVGGTTGNLGIIELAGVVLPAAQATAGQRLDVGLAWRALAPMDVAYRVYLHLLGPDGALVDQDDGEPMAWSRPTTGWAVGEVVAETRHVTVPEGAAAGDYTLRVGLYEVGGSRLKVAEGDDGEILTIVSVR
ncbi:MAG: 6-pyruvoyl-tetrahydropterin synthase-related protein [Anaerolineae bacterium]|nr:6-pyruvoyl-tetrahydropterin synthase-related protein [Anaerolineae bacterium]